MPGRKSRHYYVSTSVVVFGSLGVREHLGGCSEYVASKPVATVAVAQRSLLSKAVPWSVPGDHF